MMLRDTSVWWCQTWSERWKGASSHWTPSCAGHRACAGGISIPIIREDIRGSERLSYLSKAPQLGRGRAGIHAPWSFSATPGGIYKHLVGHRGGESIPRPLVCITQYSRSLISYWDIMGTVGSWVPSEDSLGSAFQTLSRSQSQPSARAQPGPPYLRALFALLYKILVSLAFCKNNMYLLWIT